MNKEISWIKFLNVLPYKNIKVYYTDTAITDSSINVATFQNSYELKIKAAVLQNILKNHYNKHFKMSL